LPQHFGKHCRFSFLTEDDLFEIVLKQTFQWRLSDLKSVVMHPHADSCLASMLLRGNDPFEALVHLQDHFSFSRLLTGMDFTNGHNHDALFDASDAWKVVYAEQKDEPFERKRQTKTCGLHVVETSFGRLSRFYRGAAASNLIRLLDTFLVGEKTLRRYCIRMA
jgi:hypothetical protein